MIYRCEASGRVNAVKGRHDLNGIEHIELLEPPGPLLALPDRLLVAFVNPVAVLPLPTQIRIEGGERVRSIGVVSVQPTHDPGVVRVVLDRTGDLSMYRLRLVSSPIEPAPPPGIDPALASLPFSFAVVCESELDCATPPPCPPDALLEPVIDHLAKDYGGFRRVLLDRLALLIPDWRERNPADVGVAMVEALAYVGDQLSYQQDAVATEAYLGTARRRVSVRRHARLVDYRMHDGCSARGWLQVSIASGGGAVTGRDLLWGNGRFLTGPPSAPKQVVPDSEDDRVLRRDGAQVYEVLDGPTAFADDQNVMQFHTWSGERCCLPVGATSATLLGHHPSLAPDDVLVLVETRDPSSGDPRLADPAKRHAVRLRAVAAFAAAPAHLTDPVTGDDITMITWDPADALPFAFTVSVRLKEHRDKAPDAIVEYGDVSIARGNIVLIEHGEGTQEPLVAAAERWRPTLISRPVTQTQGIDRDASLAAGVVARTDPHAALAAVSLVPDTGTGTDTTWHVVRDLLESGTNLHMVAEVDDDAFTTLRFGSAELDGTFATGTPPDDRAALIAQYRVGTGRIGNVGIGTVRVRVAGTLAAGLESIIDCVANPMPITGGCEPETIEEVRQRAPFAFFTQERAVTATDYADFARRFPIDGPPEIQRAVARLRWTGSWYTVFVAVDRVGGIDVDADFIRRLRTFLDQYRMAGHELEIVGAVSVPLEVALHLGVAAGYFRVDVEQAVRDVLSDRRLPDGRLGLFHPDNLTFGRTVYVSPIVAAAQAVPGVAFVEVTTFRRHRVAGSDGRADGELTMRASEIPTLDNDPSRPERGVLHITSEGGR